MQRALQSEPEVEIAVCMHNQGSVVNGGEHAADAAGYYQNTEVKKQSDGGTRLHERPLVCLKDRHPSYRIDANP